MLQKINTLKSRYSFIFLQFLALILSPLAYFTASKKDPTGISFFVMCLITGGLSTFALILYIFELIFTKFRIPQKITETKIYNVLFFTLLPITILVIGCSVIEILIIFGYAITSIFTN